MINKNDILINSFFENNIGIDNCFLSKELCYGLQNNIKVLQSKNLMQTANIGNQNVKDQNQQMRSDTISWIEKDSENTFEKIFILQIENFIERLNSTCYTGINDYEFHYAVYGVGGSYKKHKDQFKNDSNRKYSVINYLNQNWLENDGGQLVVFQKETAQKIQPEAQTTVFFKSNEMEHEVLKSNRERLSITGWLKRVD